MRIKKSYQRIPMKRDLDLVVKLLRYFEERESISVDRDYEIPGYEKRVVDYHLRRMFEAGLLDAEAVFSRSSPTRIIDVYPFGLSWEGHEFLVATSNSTVVAKAKRKIGGNLSDIPFSLLKELLFSILRGEIGF